MSLNSARRRKFRIILRENWSIVIAIYKQKTDYPVMIRCYIDEDTIPFCIEVYKSRNTVPHTLERMERHLFNDVRVIDSITGAITLDELYISILSKHEPMPFRWDIDNSAETNFNYMLLIEYIKQNGKFYGKKEKIFRTRGTESTQG